MYSVLFLYELFYQKSIFGKRKLYVYRLCKLVFKTISLEIIKKFQIIPVPFLEIYSAYFIFSHKLMSVSH